MKLPPNDVAIKKQPPPAQPMASTNDATAALAWETFPEVLPELALCIFNRVPVDSRLRCREVCRPWRQLLSSAAAWSGLDLSPASCVTCHAASDEALLRGFAEKAVGALTFLDVSGRADVGCWLEVGPGLKKFGRTRHRE